MAPKHVGLAGGHGYDVLRLIDDIFHEAGGPVLCDLHGVGTPFRLRGVPQALLVLVHAAADVQMMTAPV